MPDRLLVYRVLDRPPREGELYIYPKADTRIYRLHSGDSAGQAMCAVEPHPDYVEEAVERIEQLLIDRSVCPFPSKAQIRAALLPEPEPPEWAVKAAEEWYARDTNLDEVQLARHIARHAPGGE